MSGFAEAATCVGAPWAATDHREAATCVGAPWAATDHRKAGVWVHTPDPFMPDITIKFHRDFRCFKKGEAIEFTTNKSPIILAGDQGSGKSTLIQIINGEMGKKFGAEKDYSVTIPEDVVLVTHDYETGNVRGGAAFGMGGIEDMGVEITMLHLSHGQAAAIATRSLYDQLASKLKSKPKSRGLLVLDEPDSGLSIRTAAVLGASLARIGFVHHVIASLHNPYAMMMAADTVYDVELRKMVKPSEFIDRMISSAKEFTKSTVKDSSAETVASPRRTRKK